MSEPDFKAIERIFREAVGQPEDQRAEFVRRACAGDEALRCEVELLLEHDAQPHRALRHEDAARFVMQEGADVTEGRIGRYRLISVLGEGGMGTVYLAEQEHPRRTIALKVIRAPLVLPAMRRRFEREAQALARLQHPGIAAIFDAGTASDGRPYIAMEYVKGVPLTAFVQREGVDHSAKLHLMVEIAHAVQHAHDQGVIHRDLKPSNVLVTEDGRPRVVDFGVARLSVGEDETGGAETFTGQLLGTLPYMSPEQVSGRPESIDARSDVWALGVMLFELLTGRLPFETSGRSMPDVIRTIADVDPPSLGSLDRALRGDLEAIVARCLERTPARRYPTALEMSRDIERHLDDQPILARRAGSWYQFRKFARRNRVFVGFVILALVVMAGAATSSMIWAMTAEDALEHAAAAGEQTRMQAEIAEEQAYVAGIAAAYSAVEAGDLSAAIDRLQRVSEARRDSWEYRYIRSWLDMADRNWPGQGVALDTLALHSDYDDLVLSRRDGTIIEVSSSLESPARLVASLPERATSSAMLGGGPWMLAGTLGGRLHGVDTISGEVRDLGQFMPRQVWHLDVTKDGRTLVIGARESRALICAIEMGDEPAVRTVREIEGRSPALSPDGSLLVLERRGDVVLERPMDGAESTVLVSTGSTMWDAEFSVDGSLLAVSCEDGTVRAWTMVPSPALRWMHRFRGPVERLSVSPDGTALAASLFGGGVAIVRNDDWHHTIRLGHRDRVTALGWQRDSARFWTVSLDGTMRAWDAGDDIGPGGRLTGRVSEGMVSAVAMGDLDRIVSVSGGGRLVVTDIETGERLWQSSDDVKPGFVLCDAPDPREFFVQAAAGGVEKWNIDRGAVVGHAPLGGADVFAMARRGDELALGLSDGSVALIDARTLEELWRESGHERAARVVAFSPDGQAIISGGDDGSVYMWPADGALELNSPWDMGHHDGGVISAAWYASERVAVTSGIDRTLRFWRMDMRRASRAERVVAIPSVAGVLQATRDGSRVLGAVGNGQLGVWNSRTGDPLLLIPAHARAIISISLSFDGRTIVTAAADGAIRVLKVPMR